MALRPKPRRVVIDYGEFEIEVVVRPKAAEAPRAEGAFEARPGSRVAVVLDQMLRVGSVLEPRVPEGTVIYEAVGIGLDREVRVSDRLVQVPVRDDFDIYMLVGRLSGQYDKVLLFSGDKALVNDVRVRAAQEGHGNVVVHYMPPSEFASRAQLIEELLRRIRSSAPHQPG